MGDAGALLDIERIKQLKARYCRFLDHKDWAAWRELFMEDFVGDTTGAGGRVVEGADDFVAYTRETIGRPAQITVHQVHSPEISLTSPTTAAGVWALDDIVRLVPMLTLHGYGHYHERYEKRDGKWRFSASRLTRLREDLVSPLLTLPKASRLHSVATKLARRRSDNH